MDLQHGLKVKRRAREGGLIMGALVELERARSCGARECVKERSRLTIALRHGSNGRSGSSISSHGVGSRRVAACLKARDPPVDVGGRPVLAEFGLGLHAADDQLDSDVAVARTGKSYVLTTGTGSGKSLAYIVPIVDAVLHDRDANGGQRRPGVKAIVVYPDRREQARRACPVDAPSDSNAKAENAFD